MRALFQRVSRAEVRIEEKSCAYIAAGGLILLGVAREDTSEDAVWLANKISKLRVFDDGQGKMNSSITAIPSGAFLVVSQFTLYGNVEKGNRPSYIQAAEPVEAQRLYEIFVETLRVESGCRVETGVFRAMMKVELINDGPVTLWLESPCHKNSAGKDPVSA